MFPIPTEARECEEREKPAQPFPVAAVLLFHTLAGVVHRATGLLTRLVGHAVLHRKNSFAELGRTTEDRGDPHPEDGAGTTKSDRRCHTSDIPGSDRRGERGHQRCEGADISFTLGLAEQKLERVAKLPVLDDLGTD
jgi:hypothetical protein